MKYYVVSDIHGFFDELKEALTESGFFSDKEPHKLIICGDLLDRGKQIDELVKFILDLMKKDEVILIRGNHEDLLIDLVDNIYDYLPYPESTHHGSNGTLKTALSLAKMTKTKMQLDPENFRNRVLSTLFVRKIMENMIDYYETDNYIFVHGWIPCYYEKYRPREIKYSFRPNWRKCDKKEWEYARWINGMAAHKWGAYEKGKTIVCGHYHSAWGHELFEGVRNDFSPYYDKGIIAIDGCTVLTKKVNCIVIED
ncbi:MAG: metallophosphoesterase [Clostridia bacterium]|nr:metallophosphoesterase [Clostridia bacterium]